MLDIFDPECDHGRVYRALVVEPRSTVVDLSARTGLPALAVRRSLAELEREDAALCVDAAARRWDAKRPDRVAAVLRRRFEDWRQRLCESEERLTEAFHFSRNSPAEADMEFVHGREAVFRRFREIQEAARVEVLAIDRPPYFWDDAEIARQERVQSAQMARGIGYRTVYQESQSDSPLRNASMRRTVANGESARVLARPPIKMTMVDDEVAVLALDAPEGSEVLVALLVYQPALLDVLRRVFEALWSLAVPVNLADADPELGLREREILTLMASGAGDDAIARRMGLSRRTIVRHIAALLRQLGATTRFQAGAQAARRGWL